MIQELTFIDADYPRRNKKKKKLKEADQVFNSFFKSIDNTECLDKIQNIREEHSILFRGSVKRLLMDKLQNLDHYNSYRFTLFFFNYNDQNIQEGPFINLDKSNTYSGEDKITTDDIILYDNTIGKTTALYTSVSASNNPEKIFDFLNRYKLKHSKRLQELKNLVIDFETEFRMENKDLENLIKILDEDIFEKCHYSDIRVFILLRSQMTFKYKLHLPKTFVRNMQYDHLENIKYQTLYQLVKNNQLPYPVFSIECIQQFFNRIYTYPRVRKTEEEWNFLKKLKMVERREYFMNYVHHLFADFDKRILSKEVEMYNGIYKLAVKIYKYLGNSIGEYYFLYQNFYKYFVERKDPVNHFEEIRKKYELDFNKESTVTNYNKRIRQIQKKIRGKAAKYKISNELCVERVLDALETYKEYSNTSSRNNTKSASKSNFDKINMFIQAPAQREEPDFKKFVRAISSCATELLKKYFKFIEREFKQYRITEMALYDKMVNPDITNILTKERRISNYASHEFGQIINLFRQVLMTSNSREASFKIYKGFEHRLKSQFADYENDKETIETLFFYCQQLFIHMGIIFVNSKPPFYIEIMNIKHN